MKKSVLSIFALALLVAAAGFAQLPQHQTTYGTIVAIDEEQLIIATDDDQRTFQIVAGTALPDLDEFHVGDAVAVDWNVGESSDALPVVRAVRLDEREVVEVETAETDVVVTETETVAVAEPEVDVDVEQRLVDEDPTFDVEERENELVVTERTVTVTDPDTTLTDVEVQDTTTTTTTTQATLPQTASKLPLAGLIGLLSLAGALVLAVIRK